MEHDLGGGDLRKDQNSTTKKAKSSKTKGSQFGLDYYCRWPPFPKTCLHFQRLAELLARRLDFWILNLSKKTSAMHPMAYFSMSWSIKNSWKLERKLLWLIHQTSHLNGNTSWKAARELENLLFSEIMRIFVHISSFCISLVLKSCFHQLTCSTWKRCCCWTSHFSVNRDCVDFTLSGVVPADIQLFNTYSYGPF